MTINGTTVNYTVFHQGIGAPTLEGSAALVRRAGENAAFNGLAERTRFAVADLFTLIRGGEIEPAEHHVRLVVRNSSGPVA